MGELVLGTLRQRGAKHVWVVHGNGLDELSTTGSSIVHELIDDTINTFTIDSTELGLAPPAKRPHWRRTSRRQRWFERVERRTGAHRDVVVLNAAAALVVAGNATSVGDVIQLANDSIDNGSASAALDALVVTCEKSQPSTSAMTSAFSVSTPGSSANLGAGFDVLGLAVDLRAEVGWDAPQGAQSIDKHHPAQLRTSASAGQQYGRARSQWVEGWGTAPLEPQERCSPSLSRNTHPQLRPTPCAKKCSLSLLNSKDTQTTGASAGAHRSLGRPCCTAAD